MYLCTSNRKKVSLVLEVRLNRRLTSVIIDDRRQSSMMTKIRARKEGKNPDEADLNLVKTEKEKCLRRIIFVLQIEYRLVAFIKKEVKDAHIGLKTVFLLVNLVIALRLEFGVRERFLGANRIAEILDWSVEC